MNEGAYIAWSKWVERGRKPPRPAGLPKRIPQTWWTRYKAEHPPKPKPNPATDIIFCASDPLSALQAPAKYKIALTADPAYRQWASPAIITQFRAQGRTIYSWCDCRDWGSGTPASEAIMMMKDRALDGWIGQGESAAEFDHA